MPSNKRIIITPYNHEWPTQFEHEKTILTQTLQDNCLAIHHIGSTAIPGLAAKPRIDIIIESPNPVDTITPLESIGFEYMGEFNIPGHYGFRRRSGIEVNVHVYEPGHPEIALNLTFRDYLRTNINARNAYQTLKYELAAVNDATQKTHTKLSNYSTRKGLFIRTILTQAKFYTPRIVICSDKDEWNYIKQQASIDGLYTTEAAASPCYYVFYRGSTIVGYASMIHNKKQIDEISALYIEPQWENLKHDFCVLLAKWLTKNKRS